MCHYELLVILLVFYRILLDLSHTMNEFLHRVNVMEYAIRFVEVGDVALDLVPHMAWLMLFLEMAFVSPRWPCLFVLEQGLEVILYEEGSQAAISKIAEGEITPLPRVGHHEAFSTGLHHT